MHCFVTMSCSEILFGSEAGMKFIWVLMLCVRMIIYYHHEMIAVSNG